MPANPNNGEVAFEVEGVEYIFKFGVNAQTIIEDKLDMNIGAFLGRIEKGFGAKDIRLLFYAGLAQHHKLTESQVGDLLDKMGGDAASNIFMRAAELSKKKQNGVDAAAHPTKSAREKQIGMNS
jgi:hypothetical protein